MYQALLIGAGGFLGAISRFLVSKYTTGFVGAFPLGTLIVNVVGSLLLGFIYYSALNSKMISPEFRSFMGIGFIGAFTTMSTFAYETYRFYELRDYLSFALNFSLNIFLCLLAIYLGKTLSVLFIKHT